MGYCVETDPQECTTIKISEEEARNELEALTIRFPGLIGGGSEVKGSDIVEYLTNMFSKYEVV